MSGLVLIAAAATAGIASHRAYFIYGEHHARGPLLLRFYLALVFVIFVAQIITDASTTAASRETIMVGMAYAFSLFASMF